MEWHEAQDEIDAVKLIYLPQIPSLSKPKKQEPQAIMTGYFPHNVRSMNFIFISVLVNLSALPVHVCKFYI